MATVRFKEKNIFSSPSHEVRESVWKRLKERFPAPLGHGDGLFTMMNLNGKVVWIYFERIDSDDYFSISAKFSSGLEDFLETLTNELIVSKSKVLRKFDTKENQDQVWESLKHLMEKDPKIRVEHPATGIMFAADGRSTLAIRSGDHVIRAELFHYIGEEINPNLTLLWDYPWESE